MQSEITNQKSQITRVAVIGAGTMGHGIAQVAAMAGYDTRLNDANADVLATYHRGDLKRRLFPAELRRELGMENSTVYIYARRDHFEVCTERDYRERMKQAASGITVSKLEGKGLR